MSYRCRVHLEDYASRTAVRFGGDVVDQARSPEKRGCEDACGAIHALDRHQRFAISQLEILDRAKTELFELNARGSDERRSLSATREPLCEGRQNPMKLRRNAPLLARQVCVA